MKAKTTTSRRTKASPQTPAVPDYGDLKSAGFEGTTQQDFVLPFLNVLQKNSPQVDEDDERHVEGAAAGDLLIPATGRLWKGKDGVVVVPVRTARLFEEWVVRDQGSGGGGYVGSHEVDSEAVTKARAAAGGRRVGKLPVPGTGHELVETFYVFCLVLDSAESVEPSCFAVIPFSSTKIGPYKRWMTSMRVVPGAPPLFAFRTLLRTKDQRNTKGSFKNVSAEPAVGKDWQECLIPRRLEDQQEDELHPILTAARELHDQITAGQITVERPSDGSHGGSETEEESAF